MIPVILPREDKETKKEPENVGVFMKRGEKIKWSLMMFEVDFIMNGNNGVNTCSEFWRELGITTVYAKLVGFLSLNTEFVSQSSRMWP